jgi:hypothetical protein
VDYTTYVVNGYPRGWQVLGNIIGLKSESPVENQFPTIAAAMRTEAASTSDA